MAQRRGSRFPRTSGGFRRRTGWEEGPFSATTAVSVASQVVWSTAQQAVVDGLTLIRIRGEVNLFLNVASSALDGFDRVAMGICIVSENAVGVGATAIPHPLGDIAWEGWLWHWVGSLISPTATIDQTTGPASIRIPIDSKAMRKLGESDTVVGMAQFSVETGTAIAQFNANTRMLFKLP